MLTVLHTYHKALLTIGDADYVGIICVIDQKLGLIIWNFIESYISCPLIYN